MINYPNIKIGIAERYLKELKKEDLLDLIRFIKANCNMILNNDTYELYKHEIFFLHKTKVPNLYTFKVKPEEIEKLNQKMNYFQEDIKEENINNEDNKEESSINIKFQNNNINSEYQSNHINIQRYYCSNHNKFFNTNESYLNHCKSNHKFKCKYCGLMFGTFKKLNNHEPICSNIINKNIDNLSKMNISNSLGVERAAPAAINEDHKNEEPKENISKNILKSNDNEITSENGENMKSQIFESHDGKINSNEDLKMEKESSMKEKLKEKTQMKKKKEESQIKKSYFFKCYLDGIKFKTVKKYIKHFEIYHPDDFPFYCYDCQMGFYSNNAYDEHFLSEYHL